jgi:hypothetical protein
VLSSDASLEASQVYLFGRLMAVRGNRTGAEAGGAGGLACATVAVELSARDSASFLCCDCPLVDLLRGRKQRVMAVPMALLLQLAAHTCRACPLCDGVCEIILQGAISRLYRAQCLADAEADETVINAYPLMVGGICWSGVCWRLLPCEALRTRKCAVIDTVLNMHGAGAGERAAHVWGYEDTTRQRPQYDTI